MELSSLKSQLEEGLSGICMKLVRIPFHTEGSHKKPAEMTTCVKGGDRKSGPDEPLLNTTPNILPSSD